MHEAFLSIGNVCMMFNVTQDEVRFLIEVQNDTYNM